jgi:hypothetical protein
VSTYSCLGGLAEYSRRARMPVSTNHFSRTDPWDQSLCRRDVLACVPSVIQLNQEPEPVTSTPNRAFGECTALAGVIAIPTLCASAASSGEQAGSSGQPAGNGNGNVGGLAALAAAALGIAGEAADAAEAAAQASEEQTTAAEDAATQDTGTGAARFVVSSSGDVLDLETKEGLKDLVTSLVAEQSGEANENVMNIHDLSDTVGTGVDKVDELLHPAGTIQAVSPPAPVLVPTTVDTGFSFEATAVVVSMGITAIYLAVKGLGGE